MTTVPHTALDTRDPCWAGPGLPDRSNALIADTPGCRQRQAALGSVLVRADDSRLEVAIFAGPQRRLGRRYRPSQVGGAIFAGVHFLIHEHRRTGAGRDRSDAGGGRLSVFEDFLEQLDLDEGDDDVKE